jgi:GNAT superfamily N-acetyltransferase
MTLGRAKLGDHRELIAFDEVAQSDKQRGDWLKQAIRERSVWVLAVGLKIKAYGILRENFFHRPFIEMLYVARAERRKGYGASLLASLEANGLRHGEVWTSTNQSNQAMRKLLKERGFHQTGRVTGLDKGDPEVFYVKRAC